MAALSDRSLLNFVVKSASASQLQIRIISLTVSKYLDDGREITKRHKEAKYTRGDVLISGLCQYEQPSFMPCFNDGQFLIARTSLLIDWHEYP